jgi:hypothetical protein
MRERFFETHVNLAFFLVGAMVGILGGSLIDFCLISFYRWLDFYNSDTRIHPNTIPLSIDFWIFIICISLLICLFYFFYCLLAKYVNPMTNQREGNAIPSIPSRETTITNSERKSYNIIFKCFKENSTLFTILAAVATSVTLIQVFAIFVLGENWLTIILSGPFGFQILILILVSLFSVIWLSCYILYLIAIHFFYKVIKNENIQPSIRNDATVFLFIGLLGIGGIFFYLIFIWFAKLEILTALLGVYLFLLIIVVPLIVLLINVYLNFHRQSQTCFWKVLMILGIIFLIIALFLSGITIIQGMSVLNDQISKYHSDKSIIVKFSCDKIKHGSDIPVLLRLNKTNDPGFTENFTFLDSTYADCQWSTNYGYFILISSNNSIIKKQYQELTIPGCGYPSDKTYWTYDIEDYGKNKTPVIIGLSVIDRIKKVNNTLGDSRIMLKWNDTDSVDIYYNVTNFDSPF